MSSTSARPIVLAKISRALEELGIALHDRVLVAASGGADSTALLAGLCELLPRANPPIACHVDHGIRPRRESRADVDLLERVADRLGVELQVERVEPGRIARTSASEGRSLEEVARDLRYRLLEECRRAGGIRWLALAHTSDDQLETLLMRLFQGGLLQGLGGIPPRRGPIVRPLLACTREEVLDYLSVRRIPYREDATNRDERFLRNRVRHRLVPVVRTLFPAARRSAETVTRQMRALNTMLDTCSEGMLPWRKRGDAYEIEAEIFFAAPGELRVRSILRLFNAAGVSGRIPRRFLRRLEEARRTEGSSIILDGFGVVVEKVGRSVFWRPAVVLQPKKSYLIRVFEPTMYHIMPTFSFTVSSAPDGRSDDDTIRLPETLVRHPLVVRSRKPGDIIQMKGGTKSLKKLFNEWRVRDSLRDMVPVIEDRTGVWAVAGRFLGYQNRVRPPEHEERDGRNIVFSFEYSGDEL